jgi:hypothetical protein
MTQKQQRPENLPKGPSRLKNKVYCQYTPNIPYGQALKNQQLTRKYNRGRGLSKWKKQTISSYIKSVIINLAIRSLIPKTWADFLIGRWFKHD